MSVLSSLRHVLVPINREGYVFIAIPAAATLAALIWFSAWVFWPLLIFTAWVVYFFRDPVRVTPVRAGLVISPADGVVCMIANALPPPELGLSSKPMLRVSIFMNVFDCHVNRAPVSGKITKIAYKPGKFFNASLDKASDDNERNGYIITAEDGVYGMVQIAGLVARRIVNWTNEGQHTAVGQRLGMIRFGSRVDVYLPDGVRPIVGVGQKMTAGETIIADQDTTVASMMHRAS